MSICELCGRMTNTTHAIVEGSMLNVCKDCLKYGDAVEIKKPDQERVERALKVRNWREQSSSEAIEEDMIVKDYGLQIKKARLRMNMKQEDAAKAVAERVSVLQKIEAGSLEPSIKLARKLEQFFNLKLIKKSESVKAEDVKEFSVSDGSVTIGDLIKFKKG